MSAPIRLLSVAVVSLLALTWNISCSRAESQVVDAGKPAPAPAVTAPVPVEGPEVEVVFVVDTTGSMSGLIQAAKEKVWSIANTLVSAKPAPRLKMGLVAYRDHGDEYVTKRTQLTADLDAVYKDLMNFKAAGGADTPESVNQALNEAVTQMSWSANPKCYRVIFLVGDCPPHMDYKDDVKYPVTCEIAARAGIIVNTIQCGSQPETIPVWTDIASKAEGRFFRVDQSGSAILSSTPFDAELAALGRELDGTRIYYGSSEAREKLEGKVKVAAAIDKDAPIGAKAQRAEFMARGSSGGSAPGDAELLSDVAADRLKLRELKTESLPENMQKMTPEERQAYVDAQTAKRNELQKRIAELAAKRQANIEEQIRKRDDKGKDSLTSQIFDTVKEQAAKKGIDYTGGPTH